MYDKGINKTVINYVYGLGGRDIKMEDIESVYDDLFAVLKGKKKDRVTYLGVRE